VRLDKLWHGVHWILTGTAWDTRGALGKAVLGGEEFGDDGGYGPARLLAPEAVAEVAAALASLDDDGLRRRFDPDAMTEAGIYPGLWRGEPGLGETSLLPLARDLRRFYADAAAHGRWVLQALS
jgi:hypothetical protein